MFISSQFDGDGTENKSSTEESGSGPAPRGRWAQRADGQGPTIKTQDGKSVEVDGGELSVYIFEMESQSVCFCENHYYLFLMVELCHFLILHLKSICDLSYKCFIKL